jgi:hypothetical protein
LRYPGKSPVSGLLDCGAIIGAVPLPQECDCPKRDDAIRKLVRGAAFHAFDGVSRRQRLRYLYYGHGGLKNGTVIRSVPDCIVTLQCDKSARQWRESQPAAVRSTPMNIRIVLWTFCMAVAGFLLVGSPPSITSVTILGLLTGAGIGVALGIMFTHRARRRHI